MAKNIEARVSTPLVIRKDLVPIRIDEGGGFRIGQTRVTLETVIWAFKNGERPEQIKKAFPTLQLADIYSVIGYYLRHQDEIEDFLTNSELEAMETRHKIESYQASEQFLKRREVLREIKKPG